MIEKGKDITATNLPWVEKYRPNSLDELISKEDIVKTINKFMDENQLPHLLFYGPPGTGKTSTILACARKLYGPSQYSSMRDSITFCPTYHLLEFIGDMLGKVLWNLSENLRDEILKKKANELEVLELNASDDRGIGIVRGPILSFASSRTIFKSGFKLIILDEADAMTKDAQNALRRIIEKFTDNVRFCIICNYLGKIIPALKSRCTRFRFAPLVNEQIMPRLESIIQQEKIDISEDGKKAVLALGQGDMRRILNILQSTAISYSKVTEEAVYTCVGHPLRSDILALLKSLLNDDIASTYKKMKKLKVMKGLALADIITELHTYVHRIEFPKRVICDLLIALSDIEYRLESGASESIQLSGLLAAFHHARVKAATLAKPEDQ